MERLEKLMERGVKQVPGAEAFALTTRSASRSS
jgi:hypothetical protein